MFSPLNVKEFVSVQPMTLSPGLIIPLNFKYCNKTFELYEELWLEDFKDGEMWCPQIEDDGFVDNDIFYKMRRKELIFEDWEIEQLTAYVEGIGNNQKQLVGIGFKAMWFPEK